MSRVDVDAVVVGAGVVGCAAALALAERGCEVLVADSRLPTDSMPRDDEAYDLRVYALSHGSRELLDQLRVWTLLPRARVAAYRRMSVWDEHGSGGIDFDASLIGENALGFIVEQRALLAALKARLLESPRVELRPLAITDMSLSDGAAEVSVGNGSRLRARVVVAADGARSTLREAAGIALEGDDYAQRAVVAHLRFEGSHGHTARQRFVSGGPLALLPLADGRVSLVWSLPDAEAARVLSLPEQDFLREVTAASGGVLGACLDATERASFPLHRWLARNFSADRLLLAGDAAHGVHPLAGQGLNLGLADVRCLRDVLGAALARREDIGAPALLKRYARARQGDNAIAGHAFGALQHLFASRSPLLAFARGVGMRVADRVTPLKRLLAEHAANLT